MVATKHAARYVLGATVGTVALLGQLVAGTFSIVTMGATLGVVALCTDRLI